MRQFLDICRKIATPMMGFVLSREGRTKAGLAVRKWISVEGISRYLRQVELRKASASGVLTTCRIAVVSDAISVARSKQVGSAATRQHNLTLGIGSGAAISDLAQF